MGKVIRLFSALAAALFFCGCTRDAAYIENVDDPGYDIFSRTYEWHVNNLFRCAELADFYSRYNDIRTDRAESEALADSFFGDRWTDLYYEKVSVYMVGTMRMTGEGQYEFDPVFVPDWRDTSFVMKVNVEDGVIGVACDSETFKAEASMRVENSTVYMDSLTSLYRDASGSEMEICTDGDSGEISLPECTSERIVYVPEAGELAVKVTGARKVRDAFRIVFEPGRTGVERNGEIKYYQSPQSGY